MSLQPGGTQSVTAGTSAGGGPSPFLGIEALLAFARSQASPASTLASRAKAAMPASTAKTSLGSRGRKAIDKVTAAKAADEALLTNAPIMTAQTQSAVYAAANQAAARARGAAGGGY